MSASKVARAAQLAALPVIANAPASTGFAPRGSPPAPTGPTEEERRADFLRWSLNGNLYLLLECDPPPSSDSIFCFTTSPRNVELRQKARIVSLPA